MNRKIDRLRKGNQHSSKTTITYQKLYVHSFIQYSTELCEVSYPFSRAEKILKHNLLKIKEVGSGYTV